MTVKSTIGSDALPKRELTTGPRATTGALMLASALFGACAMDSELEDSYGSAQPWELVVTSGVPYLTDDTGEYIEDWCLTESVFEPPPCLGSWELLLEVLVLAGEQDDLRMLHATIEDGESDGVPYFAEFSLSTPPESVSLHLTTLLDFLSLEDEALGESDFVVQELVGLADGNPRETTLIISSWDTKDLRGLLGNRVLHYETIEDEVLLKLPMEFRLRNRRFPGR